MSPVRSGEGLEDTEASGAFGSRCLGVGSKGEEGVKCDPQYFGVFVEGKWRVIDENVGA